MGEAVIPPLPPGLTLNEPPPLPEGLTLNSPKVKAVPGVNYFDESMDESGVAEDGAFDSFKKGLAKSTLETVLGAKELMGMEADTDQKALDMLRADADASGGWATAGAVGGDIAQLALPGMQAAKLAKFGKALPLAAEVATTAGQGFLKAPQGDKTRLESATEAGVSDIVGNVLFKGLGKLKSGASRLPEADSLLKQGVRLTPGQATDKGIIRGTEYVMNWFPGLARATQKAKDTALKDWNKVVLNRAAPIGTKITAVGREGNKQLAKAYEDAYSAAWGKAGEPARSGLADMVRIAKTQGDQLGTTSQSTLNRIVADVRRLAKQPTSSMLKDLDNTLRKKIKLASGGNAPELEDALKSMRVKLRESISPEALAELKKVDSQYPKYLAVKKAATSKGAREADMLINPSQLMTGSKQVGKETRTFTGTAPLQGTAHEGLHTIGRKEPSPIIDFLKGLSTNIEVPGTAPLLRSGGRAVLGETTPQRVLQKVVDPVADALRQYGVTGGTATTAYEENN